MRYPAGAHPHCRVRIFPADTLSFCLILFSHRSSIRSQYQQEKLTDEFFAQIFADFQPEETYNESQIMNILLDYSQN